MRRADVARGVAVVRNPLLVGALDAAPVVLLDVGEVVAAPDVVLGELLLGAALDAPLDASVFAPFDMPLGTRVESGVLAAGRLRSTSPVDVLVTLRAGDALLVDRTQSVVLMAESVLAALAPVEALSRVVDGVGAVPFAPFIVFSPLKR